MPATSDTPSCTGVAPAASEPEADLAQSGVLLRRHGSALAERIGQHPAALAAAMEDRDATPDQRLVTGTLLALVGDPRLAVRQPQMIDVPAATVTIGLAVEQIDAVTARWAPLGVERDWIAKEAPAHAVRVEAFRIGRFPVTNLEYLEFVLARPQAERPSSWPHGTFPWAAANHPVYTVSPEAADAYCAWLAAETGRAFRLPSEAEWEYAAHGGSDREFPWGDEWDPQRANTAEAGPLCTTPVGVHLEGASPFGVLDLAGNVEEYVADDYAPYPGGAVIEDDLTATYGQRYRVARGGSFARHGDLARCRRRHGWYHSPHYAMGFRLAESR